MSEQLETSNTGESPEKEHDEFTPVATMVLLVVYIVIFATAWGLVYFTDLLARR